MDDPTPAPQERLRSEFEGDPDMAEIVAQFAAEMPGKVRQLRTLWEERELETLVRIAHQLKGSGGGYGYPSISNAAGRLESSLQRLVGGNAPPALSQLQSEFARLIELCRSVSGED